MNILSYFCKYYQNPIRMTNNKKKVKGFFNDISTDYKKKYSKQNKFHYYFFIERLQKATKRFDFSNKKVLDLGAGTGDLYDFITNLDASIDYSGTDVSEGMLSNSSIPEDRRFLGDYNSLKLPYSNYNYAFMLGVSTYLSDEQMNGYVQFMAEHVEDEVIVTFTNKYCFDNFYRTLLKPIISLIPNKRNVLSQKIDIHTYTPKQAIELFSKEFDLVEIEWLNHTVFPLNLIFPSLSIKIANLLDKMKSRFWLSLFSSDFIIKAKKN